MNESPIKLMKPSHRFLLFILPIGLAGFLALPAFAQSSAPVKPVAVRASSENPKYPARNAIDGVVSDSSRWVSQPSPSPAFLEIDLGAKQKLGGARFVIDASPKDFHYPYHPEVGNKGYTEGWIQFNTPFNASMAYLAFDRTKISLAREGDSLVVHLEAPLNFDYNKIETGTVTVTSTSGGTAEVIVTEDSPNSRTLTGRIRIQPGAASKGTLQARPGDTIEASYGFGYLGHRATLKL